MDDFPVYGSDFKTCLDSLCKVLARCEETNLVQSWEKCHKVSTAGIEVDCTKIEVMTGLPAVGTETHTVYFF